MSIEQMKHYIINKYPGEKWFIKVQKMSDYQILAIYTRLVNKK